jgi:hypothetical protein
MLIEVFAIKNLMKKLLPLSILTTFLFSLPNRLSLKDVPKAVSRFAVTARERVDMLNRTAAHAATGISETIGQLKAIEIRLRRNAAGSVLSRKWIYILMKYKKLGV